MFLRKILLLLIMPCFLAAHTDISQVDLSLYELAPTTDANVVTLVLKKGNESAGWCFDKTITIDAYVALDASLKKGDIPLFKEILKRYGKQVPLEKILYSQYAGYIVSKLKRDNAMVIIPVLVLGLFLKAWPQSYQADKYDVFHGLFNEYTIFGFTMAVVGYAICAELNSQNKQVIQGIKEILSDSAIQAVDKEKAREIIKKLYQVLSKKDQHLLDEKLKVLA